MCERKRSKRSKYRNKKQRKEAKKAKEQQRMSSQEELETKYTDQLDGLRVELANQILPLSEAGTDEDALNAFLESDALDDQLAQYVMLMEGTPSGLAAKPENEDLIRQLFENTALLKQMLLADGPRVRKIGRQHGKDIYGPAPYGAAMKIYTDIQNATEQDVSVESGGFLFRLALAVSLEHATPIAQENPKEPGDDADRFVNPVKRYLHYEQAKLSGELDPAVTCLTTWDLRFVIDGAEPNYVLSWGRNMLRNFRPDNVLLGGHVWRYVNMVRSDIRYGSGHVKYDRPELQLYQNILMNGGVCGRRAFFGRFILRAFGIPTTARPSRGHGALCHWTPATEKGWVVNLGPNWGKGWTKHPLYHDDTDFRDTSRARTFDTVAYWKVKRAQWVGDVLAEKRFYGEKGKQDGIGFWYGTSLKVQRIIIEAGVTNPPPLEDKSNNLILMVQGNPVDHNNAKQILYSGDKIVIPAAATSTTKDVSIMNGFDKENLQIYLPSFMPQGLTTMRGGTWKNDADSCTSGYRMLSGGYGKYHNWGFRAAMTLPGKEEGEDDDEGAEEAEECPAEFVLKIPNSEDAESEECVTMEFVYIPPGTFVMGGERDYEDGRFKCVEVPLHEVTMSKGYYIGKYPVTQAQYQAVTKTNPSKSTKLPNCPVDDIGLDDAEAFCSKLSESTGLYDVRLPTEAEWEYACRGGKGNAEENCNKYFFGDDNVDQLGDYAWYSGNSGGKSHPVGEKLPNPFGLYDIYGNVCERVADKYAKDYYASSPNEPMIDPTGPSQGTKSVITYTLLEVPMAGEYALTTQVVTANYKQRINVAANPEHPKKPTKVAQQVIEFPFTLGEWQESEPVTILLNEGENKLVFLA